MPVLQACADTAIQRDDGHPATLLDIEYRQFAAGLEEPEMRLDFEDLLQGLRVEGRCRHRLLGYDGERHLQRIREKAEMVIAAAVDSGHRQSPIRGARRIGNERETDVEDWGRGRERQAAPLAARQVVGPERICCGKVDLLAVGRQPAQGTRIGCLAGRWQQGSRLTACRLLHFAALTQYEEARAWLVDHDLSAAQDLRRVAYRPAFARGGQGQPASAGKRHEAGLVVLVDHQVVGQAGQARGLAGARLLKREAPVGWKIEAQSALGQKRQVAADLADIKNVVCRQVGLTIEARHVTGYPFGDKALARSGAMRRQDMLVSNRRGDCGNAVDRQERRAMQGVSTTRDIRRGIINYRRMVDEAGNARYCGVRAEAFDDATPFGIVDQRCAAGGESKRAPAVHHRIDQLAVTKRQRPVGAQ
ncbi:hypothetical protein [Reyranella massiliensis]|uniref:hypothetical protein n=1 Tax=Reyranella massiliensis TaxID=445220 RepID=UPI0011D2350E|nr:hypothetical protein [Reyranella massiliensis]